MIGNETVPYEDIDPEIRPLVRLLNDIPGISTRWSCAGHDRPCEGYVSFEAASQDALAAMAAALPRMGFRGTLTNNHLEASSIDLIVEVDANRRLRYSLRISGDPPYAQRRALDEVERALSAVGIPQPDGTEEL